VEIKCINIAGSTSGAVGMKNNNNLMINKSTQNHQTISYATPSFKGYQDILSHKTTPFLKSSYSTFEALYKGYKESLGEVSLNSIKDTVTNVCAKTGASKKETVDAMQKLTQFANMRSVYTI
jgi:hypothetical protein